MEHWDVAVIGGGLLGCFAARNLCRWRLPVVLLEAREDLCTGISRANTAIVYPGYDHKPGSLKAEMTVRANADFERLCGELDVPFSRCGSLMIACGERAEAVLREKYENGRALAVPGLRLLGREEALALEPGLTPDLRAALFAPTAGTVNPWQLGIAAFENAAANGAAACLNAPVRAMERTEAGYLLHTAGESCACRAVINCAGLSADRVQELLFPSPVRIVPSAGDYLVLDRAAAGLPRHIIQYEPEDGGKGLSAVPTVEGSLLLGPSERENGTDFATSAAGLDFVRRQAARVLPALNLDDTIRAFAALRPNPRRPDGGSIGSFVIDNPAPGFYSFIGIKTPGLSCANELGAWAAARAAAYLGAERNDAFRPERRGIERVRAMSMARRAAAIAENPDYGQLLCVCEEVSLAEAREAIRRGAVTVDGIKRRTGTAMGRCQGGRCEQKLTALLARELGVSEYAVTKDGAGSEILGGAP